MGPAGLRQPSNREAVLRAELRETEANYVERLRALKAAFPRVLSCREVFEAGKCAHGVTMLHSSIPTGSAGGPRISYMLPSCYTSTCTVGVLVRLHMSSVFHICLV